jgi:Fe-coproporphyrin III synthase
MPELISESPGIYLPIFLKRTGNLLIHLLNKCNLSCRHCYLDAGADGNKILPLDLVMRILDEADSLELSSVQLSGGEPFLYPDIHKILKTTIGKKFGLTVSTNATSIDAESMRLLAEKKARVVTSIDGPAEHHDAFRGKSGSFSKTESTVNRLISNAIPVKIVMTVCEDSMKYLEWCAQWAYTMKAQGLQFQPLENIGRGIRIEDLKLSVDKLNDLFILTSDLAAFYAPKGLQISLTYQSRDFMIAHPCTAFVCNGKNCHRGVEKELKKIVIREDGTILPELVDIDKRFAIGNIYTDTLKNNLISYLDDGYRRFDRFCREVYEEVVTSYPSPLVPWNEILSEKSREVLVEV